MSQVGGWAAAAAAAAALAASAAPAGAVTTVGSVGADDVQPTNTGACPASNCTFLGVAGADPLLVVPVNGVIVRWRVRTGSTPPDAQVALRVLRPAGAGSYAAAGTSDAEPLTAMGVRAFDARLPVLAGDALGFDDRSDSLLFASDPNAAVQVWNPALGAGPARGPTSSTVNRRPLLAADIEADADEDGYGDETQDACPANAQRHLAPCDPGTPVADLEITALSRRSLARGVTWARAGEPFTVRAVVRNNGTDPAEGTTVRFRIPAGAVFHARTPSDPCKRPRAGRATRTALVCQVGHLPAGASASVTAVLSLATGAFADIGATAQSVTADPVRSNDSKARRIELAPSVALRLVHDEYLVEGDRRMARVLMEISTSERAAVTVGLYRAGSRPSRRLVERTFGVSGRRVLKAFTPSVGFGGLAAGNYRLRVQAKDPGGLQSRVVFVRFAVARVIDSGSRLNPVSG